MSKCKLLSHGELYEKVNRYEDLELQHFQLKELYDEQQDIISAYIKLLNQVNFCIRRKSSRGKVQCAKCKKEITAGQVFFSLVNDQPVHIRCSIYTIDRNYPNSLSTVNKK